VGPHPSAASGCGVLQMVVRVLLLEYFLRAECESSSIRRSLGIGSLIAFVSGRLIVRTYTYKGGRRKRTVIDERESYDQPLTLSGVWSSERTPPFTLPISRLRVKSTRRKHTTRDPAPLTKSTKPHPTVHQTKKGYAAYDHPGPACLISLALKRSSREIEQHWVVPSRTSFAHMSAVSRQMLEHTGGLSCRFHCLHLFFCRMLLLMMAAMQRHQDLREDSQILEAGRRHMCLFLPAIYTLASHHKSRCILTTAAC
jgi:hypothetical protein